jgi:D-alanyl-D-alanine dipeptidase
MKTFRLIFPLLAAFFLEKTMAFPEHFVYLKDIDPTIIQDVKYATRDNFIGRPVAGYPITAQCILTRPTALALADIQKKLKSESKSLKIFDCYRPQSASNDFLAWSKDESDQKKKAIYYPRVNKIDFFKLGYVGEKSGHSRGSTVDLTIVKIQPGQQPYQLDMGTHFDFMDEWSHFSAPVSQKAQANRRFLRDLMQQAGFKPYDKEWWHFTLKDEPYPDTYFDFPVG